MGDFFVYILKSAACLIVFYLFFHLLLNRDTFHRFNRIAVLCILVLSIAVPFCNINTQTQVNQAMVQLHQLFVESNTVAQRPDKSLTWIHGVLLIYLAGVLFFICRNIYFLVRIRLLLQQGKIKRLDNRVKLVVCDNTISPFSWMNYIVISEVDLNENGKAIITHEMAHVCKHHSIDILLADICVIFQWFNPAAWLVKQELQNIHEYEADEYVLNEGIDAKHYQILLIKKAVGKRLYSMANSFNHSKLKKRITMMSKQKSSPWARLKYLYVLPVTAVAVTAFARPEISRELKKISEAKVSDFVEMTKSSDAAKSNSFVNDTTDVFEFTNNPVKDYKEKDVPKKASPSVKDEEVLVMTNILIKESEKESMTKRVSGVVKDSSGNPVVGASIVIVGTKTGTITGMDGKFVLDVPDDATLAVSMIDMKSIAVKVDKSSPLTITLTSQESDKKTTVAGDVVLAGKSGSAQEKKPLVIVDGKKKLDGISDIDPLDIESVTVLKNEHAVKQYGTEGENGVIIIITKNKNK